MFLILRSFFKKHYFGIVIALLFGLFSVAPQMLFLHRAGDDFNGVYGEFNGDALYYLSRVQEVIDGYPGVNNSYLLEHKTDAYPQTSFPEVVVAGVAKLFNLSHPELQYSLDFIVPFFFLILKLLIRLLHQINIVII